MALLARRGTDSPSKQIVVRLRQFLPRMVTDRIIPDDVDQLRSRAYSKVEDENRTETNRETQTAPERDSRDDSGRVREGGQRSPRSLHRQAREQAPESPLRELPEDQAKADLTERYAQTISDSRISDWEKSAVIWGYLPDLSITESKGKASNQGGGMDRQGKPPDDH